MEEENEERKFQNQKTRMKNYCFYFLEMRPVIPSKKKKRIIAAIFFIILTGRKNNSINKKGKRRKSAHGILNL